MLHKHKLLNVFLQFGGHVEKNENPWQALTHELLEESGYTLDQLTLLQPPVRIKTLHGAQLHPTPVVLLTHEFNHEHTHTDIAWAFTADEPPAHAVGSNESDTVQSFTRGELMALSSESIPKNVREIGLFVLDICLLEWERVKPQ